MRTKNIYIAALFSCILFCLSSCDNSDKQVYDYRFSADLAILDNSGTVYKVNQPVKMKITVSNLVDRTSYLSVSHTAGDKKSYIYIEDKEDATYQTNDTLQNKFNNGVLMVNYVPKNAGIQTVTFTIKNGEYSVDVSKTITVESGTDITFDSFSPLTQRLGYESTASFTIKNSLDKDNYYNYTYEVISGSANVPTCVIDGKSLVPGDTTRLISGLGSISKSIAFSQLNEGKTVIKFSIIDRYKNVTERTYEIHFIPDVVLTISGSASFMNYNYPLTSYQRWNNSIPILYFEFKSSTSKSGAYNVLSRNLKAEFDYSYNRRYSNKRTEWVTEHVILPLQKGKNSSIYYILKGRKVLILQVSNSIALLQLVR